jgi:hypothetical protein
MGGEMEGEGLSDGFCQDLGGLKKMRPCPRAGVKHCVLARVSELDRTISHMLPPRLHTREKAAKSRGRGAGLFLVSFWDHAKVLLITTSTAAF